MSFRITRSQRPRTSLVTLAGAVICAVLGTAAPVRAELTPAQKQEVRDHYDKASRAYDVQKFAEAVDEYQKTYEISGDPAMLFNVAQAYRLNGQSQEAIFYYRRYLERSPAAPNRAATEQKIADLEKSLEAARTTPAAPAVPPAIPPAAPPPPMAAPSGSVLSPAPGPVATFPPPKVVTVDSENTRNGKRVAGVALLSLGGAGLLTAAITGKLAANKGDNLTYASSVKGTFDPETEKAGKRLDNVAVAALVIGAGASVAGGILLVLSRHSSAEDASASTRVSTRTPSIAPLFGGGTIGASAALSF